MDSGYTGNLKKLFAEDPSQSLGDRPMGMDYISPWLEEFQEGVSKFGRNKKGDLHFRQPACRNIFRYTRSVA
jgi:hypothetical protein